MTDDEIITHRDVLDGLSPAVRHALILALPPEQRGWWTAAEIDDQPGEWVEVTTMGSAEPRYIRGRRP